MPNLIDSFYDEITSNPIFHLYVGYFLAFRGVACAKCLLDN